MASRLDELWATHGPGDSAAPATPTKEDEALASLRDTGFAAGGGTRRLDQLWATHGPAGATDEAAPDVSKGESLARGGLQGATSGFGDEAAAAIDTAVSKIPGVRNLAQTLHDDKLPSLTNPNLTYAERRDAYRKANKAAEDANPLTYTAGNILGTGVQTMALPGAGTATSVGRLAARGAAEGAAAGLGYSDADLTKGDVAGALKDTAEGAAVGGVTSAAIGAVTNKLARNADTRAKRDLIDAITENEGSKATAKTSKSVRQQAEKIADVLDYEPNQPIKASLNDPKKALQLIQDRTAELNRDVRTPTYEALQNISGGVKAGDLVKPFEDELTKLSSGGPNGRGVTGSNATKKALLDHIVDMKNNWSRTLSPEEQFQTIADKVVPAKSPLRASLSGKPLQEQQSIVSQMFGQDGARTLSEHDAAILAKPIQPLKFFDPNEMITELEAREHLTGLQESAADSFGRIQDTATKKRIDSIVKIGQDAQNAHLEEVARLNPEAKDVVQNVHDYNKEASGLLAVKGALKTIAEKQEATNTKGLAHQIHDKGSLLGLGYGIAAGHPVAAAAGYGALKIGVPAAKMAANKTNIVLANLMKQARGGSNKAALVAYAIEQGIPEAAAQQVASRAVALTAGGAQQ